MRRAPASRHSRRGDSTPEVRSARQGMAHGTYRGRAVSMPPGTKPSYKINIPDCQRFRGGKPLGFAGFSDVIRATPPVSTHESLRDDAMAPTPKHSRQSQSINPMEMAGLGMEIAAPILLGAWVSAHWELGPWPILAGLACGLIGATAHVIVFLKRQQNNSITYNPPPFRSHRDDS